ncbi:Na+/H+ antiporter family protein [Psychrobacter cryohalolentis]|uniref:Na+/H+ antiporter NhaC n=1 Tax=Psychrobacter cryohalolentis (strain ATCC BAA-1226 / DSM 17306 / VKM B-2378 / K5) TaxID=335284 RepID=Q1Q9H8_PSYCK|nr:Na+/H+ antiporter family protein [Psychrobacter cryohalolentis]ABE75675.1 Na+/H+ antiporter NhaC [Psychrobacter cryohalolentis K5]ASE25866.1 sodium:proton antiporter [Psychrobacter cryohalolentis]
MTINAVLLAVVIMLGLSLARVHVVLSLLIGALAGGLIAGLGMTDTLNAFQEGIKNGAQIALSYALLGAFAVAIAHSGLPQSLAGAVIKRIDAGGTSGMIKYMLFAGLVTMSCFSQNLIPIHIAFIPLLVPPLLLAFNRMHIDRRLIACLITFGLVTTYMFIPYGFGDIYLNQIMLKNVGEAGIDISNISVTKAMAIPALGMFVGLLIAVFISYRKPRQYQQLAIDKAAHDEVLEGDELSKTAATAKTQSKMKTLVAIAAIVTAFVVQLYTDSLLLGSMFGFGVFMATGVVKWRDADTVFNDGIKLMAMIGFIMITAQGFAEVMKATEQIQPLVDGAASLFAGNKAMAAFIMLLIGLIVTMGIGSSFSTIPILAAIYVPLCISLGFSPLATVAIIGTAGALGDAGSPASDSTLGPTSGLNVDGQHDHIKDSVVPTFIHYNIPLLIFGWIAAMVL